MYLDDQFYQLTLNEQFFCEILGQLSIFLSLGLREKSTERFFI